MIRRLLLALLFLLASCDDRKCVHSHPVYWLQTMWINNTPIFIPQVMDVCDQYEEPQK